MAGAFTLPAIANLRRIVVDGFALFVQSAVARGRRQMYQPGGRVSCKNPANANNHPTSVNIGQNGNLPP